MSPRAYCFVVIFTLVCTLHVYAASNLQMARPPSRPKTLLVLFDIRSEASSQKADEITSTMAAAHLNFRTIRDPLAFDYLQRNAGDLLSHLIETRPQIIVSLMPDLSQKLHQLQQRGLLKGIHVIEMDAGKDASQAHLFPDFENASQLGGWLRDHMEHPPLQQGNKALFVAGTQETALLRRDLLRQEPDEVIMAAHIHDREKIGTYGLAEMWDAKRKAPRKIEKLLLDGYGDMPFTKRSWRTRGGFLKTPKKIWTPDPAQLKVLSDAGIEIRVWNPFKWKRLLALDWSLTSRIHLKNTYYRGLQTASQGDKNNQNMCFGLDCSPEWKDRSYYGSEVAVQGPEADRVGAYLEYLFQLAEPYDFSSVTPRQYELAKRKMERYLKLPSHDIPETNWLKQFEPVNDVEFVADYPSDKGRASHIVSRVIEIIDNLKRNDSFYIISPYVRLTDRLREAILSALRRQANGFIITASINTTDRRTSSMAFSSQLDALKRLGAKVMQHKGPDFLHAKNLWTSDGTFVTSSLNFNPRSEHTDLEGGFIFRDKGFAAKVKDRFIDAMIETQTEPHKPPKGFTCDRLLAKIASLIPLTDHQF